MLAKYPCLLCSSFISSVFCSANIQRWASCVVCCLVCSTNTFVFAEHPDVSGLCYAILSDEFLILVHSSFVCVTIFLTSVFFQYILYYAFPNVLFCTRVHMVHGGPWGAPTFPPNAVIKRNTRCHQGGNHIKSGPNCQTN